MIRVLLVMGHRLVREALGDVLAAEPGIEVVGEAGDCSGAFERLRSLSPDVVVFDIGLRDLSGIGAGRRLKESCGPGIRIVALSDHVNHWRWVGELMRAGVDAYVTKSSSASELVCAIRAAAGGCTYLCSEVAGMRDLAMRDGSKRGETHCLSRREREVLSMIAEGRRSPTIAEQLNMAIATVEVHRRNIRRKIGRRTVAELTRYAIREGLVVP